MTQTLKPPFFLPFFSHSSDIWCQTYDLRVYLFDTRSEKFIDVLRPYENQSKQTYAVRTIYALPKGISWILCEQEAFRIDELSCKEGEGITLYSPEQKESERESHYHCTSGQ